MTRLGTDTSSWWCQEDNAPSHTSRRTKAFLKEREIQLLNSIFTSGKSGKRQLGDRQFTPQLELRAISCAQCQLSTQKPLKRRAPLGSFTDAWRACAPQAAIPSTACDGPAHVHAFFLVSFSASLETRTKESNRWAGFFCVLHLKAPQKRLFGPRHREPIEILRVVRARACVFGVHVCVFFFPFASPSLLFFLSLCPLSSSSSFFISFSLFYR